MTRYEGSHTADERAMLLAFLRHTRECAVAKADDDLRRSLVPSGTTILGLIKHLAYVERFWFQVVFLGRDEAQLDFPWTDEDPDAGSADISSRRPPATTATSTSSASRSTASSATD